MDHLRQPYRKIVLFGDQLENGFPAIQELYRRAPSSIYLQHFLRVATDAARQSLDRLSSTFEGPRSASFDSFLTLAEDGGGTKKQGPGSIAQTLLSCVAQLGHLVLLDLVSLSLSFLVLFHGSKRDTQKKTPIVLTRRV